MKTYQVKIKEKHPAAKDACSFIIDIPKEHEAIFKYTCGQYVTGVFRTEDGVFGRGYSFSSSPLTDKEIRFTVKKVPSGRFSHYLVDKVQAGDTFEITAPEGDFFNVEQSQKNLHYFLIGAGSGVTPLFSILKTVLQDPKNKVTFLYGNRDEESIIFKDELDELEKTSSLTVHHFLTAENQNSYEKGRITEQHIENHFKSLGSDLPVSAYICGPQGLMDMSQNTLEGLGLSKEWIHVESFGPSHDTSKSASSDSEDSEDDIFVGDKSSKSEPQTIIAQLDDGEVVEVSADKDTPILETLLNAGHNPPFSCMTGNCMACMAVVNEGLVVQEELGILDESEVEEKMTLTCQSRPRSKVVKLKYEQG